MSRYAILCPICQKVSNVKWVNDLEIAFLACGHSRTTSLLPKGTGLVGMEDLSSKIGHANFPASLETRA
jgi:hypothetical protein